LSVLFVSIGKNNTFPKNRESAKCGIMIRKLFWLSTLAGLYFWIVAEREDENLSAMSKMVVQYAQKKWEEMDFTLHIHTPGCMKRKGR
jgi:hypothetical protein